MVRLRLRVSLHPVTNRWAHLVYPGTAVHSVPVLRCLLSAELSIYSYTVISSVFVVQLDLYRRESWDKTLREKSLQDF